MPDIPNFRFINLVDQPADLTYSQFGEASVNLDPAHGGILNVTPFRRVSICIGATKAHTAQMFMGKISNATLANRFNIQFNNQIQTFDVVGPEISLILFGGVPQTTEKVQVWVYLRSQYKGGPGVTGKRTNCERYGVRSLKIQQAVPLSCL